MQSRVENVRPGDLYFALRTDDFDGVRSIPQAIEQGAVGIVLEVSSEDIIDTTLTRNGASKAKREEIRAHRYLQENGIEDVENKLPIVPVESLNPAMSQLGCVFYGKKKRSNSVWTFLRLSKFDDEDRWGCRKPWQDFDSLDSETNR